MSDDDELTPVTIRAWPTSRLLAVAYNESTQRTLFHGIVGGGASHGDAKAEIERVLGLVIAEIDRRFPVKS
jgi:hypothetical protein